MVSQGTLTVIWVRVTVCSRSTPHCGLPSVHTIVKLCQHAHQLTTSTMRKDPGTDSPCGQRALLLRKSLREQSNVSFPIKSIWAPGAREAPKRSHFFPGSQGSRPCLLKQEE